MLPTTIRDTIEVHVIGDGKCRETLAAGARVCGLSLGFHDAVAAASDLLLAFNAVLMPSRLEGFGPVALEAKNAGTPIIASDAPGLREVQPGDWPFVVKTGSAQSLAHCIETFLKGSDDRAAMSRRASYWARCNFSFDDMVEQYDQVYRSYVEPGGDASTR